MMSIYFTRENVVATIPMEKGQTVTAKLYIETFLPEVFQSLLEKRKKKGTSPILFAS